MMYLAFCCRGTNPSRIPPRRPLDGLWRREPCRKPVEVSQSRVQGRRWPLWRTVHRDLGSPAAGNGFDVERELLEQRQPCGHRAGVVEGWPLGGRRASKAAMRFKRAIVTVDSSQMAAPAASGGRWLAFGTWDMGVFVRWSGRALYSRLMVLISTA